MTYQIDHKYCRYYCGCDFARYGEDSSVIIIIEKRNDNLKVCYIEEIKKKKLTEVVGKIKLLDEMFDFQKICLDETGLGAGPTDMLTEEFGYRVEGITFTIRSKQDIYSNLKKLMEQYKIKIPNHRKLYWELSELQYEVSSSGNIKIHHPEKGHDDYCDALALACWACKEEEYYKPSIA